MGKVNSAVDNRYSAEGPYWFDDLKQAYDYPAYSAKTNGTGVSVAILMSDLIFPGDVTAAFNHENFTTITGLPAPSVTTITIDGGGVVNGQVLSRPVSMCNRCLVVLPGPMSLW